MKTSKWLHLAFQPEFAGPCPGRCPEAGPPCHPRAGRWTAGLALTPHRGPSWSISSRGRQIPAHIRMLGGQSEGRPRREVVREGFQRAAPGRSVVATAATLL